MRAEGQKVTTAFFQLVGESCRGAPEHRRPLRFMRFTLSLLFALPALAQFGPLATDSSGSRAVFSSSLSLRNLERQDWPKLFSARSEGVASLLTRTPDSSGVPPQFIDNFYRLDSPELSSDGSLLAFTAERPCIGGSSCLNVVRRVGEVRRSDGSLLFTRGGDVRISANGRWAFSGGTQTLSFSIPPQIVNLETKQSWDLPRGIVIPKGPRVLSDDGTFVFTTRTAALSLFRPGRPIETIPLGFAPTDRIAISRNSSHVVLETGGPASMLVVVNLHTSLVTPAVWSELGASSPSLSDDGQTLAFLSGANWEAANDGLSPQAWSMDLVSGRLRQLTSDPSGLNDAVLSGDAQTMWAVARDGRILRVDVHSREAATISGPSTQISEPLPWRTAPGGRYTVRGSGLAFATVSDGNFDFPVLERTPDSLTFLIPAVVPFDTLRLFIGDENSAFQPFLLTTDIVAAAPLFQLWGDAVQSWHLSPRRPVDDADPARPGETIEVWLTGLGDATAPLLWQIREGYTGVPQPVTVTGVQPTDQPGLYTALVTMPAAVPSTPVFLMCFRLAQPGTGDVARLALAP